MIELKGGNDSFPHDIEIRNLLLRGPGTGSSITDDVASSHKQGCGVISDEVEAENILISDCTFENMSGCGVIFANSGSNAVRRVRITNCKVINSRRPAVVDDVQNYKDIYFYGLEFDDIVLKDNISVFNFGEGEITTGPRIGNDSGIAFVTTGAPVDGIAKNVLISHNRCEGHFRHGLITYYGQAVHSGVSVTHNRCTNNGWIGLYVNMNEEIVNDEDIRMVVASNYCYLNGFYDNRNSTVRGGIVITGGTNIVISNNICNRNGKTSLAGIDPVVNAEYAAGIRVRGDGIVIEGNITHYNRDRGITSWSSPSFRMSVQNNRSSNNDKDGILIQGAAASDQPETGRGFIATGNMCAHNGENGIRAYYINDALINSNFCRCNGTAGIQLDGNTANIMVHGNLLAGASGIPFINNPGGNINFVSDNSTFVDSAC